MPSLLKGWIDRVFTPGIAYSANNRGSFILNYLRGRQFKKLLKTKRVSILGELGREVNTSSTRHKYLQKVAEEVKVLD